MSNVRHLRHPEKARNPENPLVRKPDWIRVKAPTSEGYAATRRLMRENTKLKSEMALKGLREAGSLGPLFDSPALTALQDIDVAGVKLARRKVAGLDKDALRGLADSLKAQIKSGVVVLACEGDGKVQIVVAVTPDLTGRIKAGQIVKEIAPLVGGGGGGRPDFAEAGGKQPEKIDEMLDASRRVVEALLTKS